MPAETINLQSTRLPEIATAFRPSAFDDTYLHSRATRAIPRKSPFHFVTQLTFFNSAGKSQALGCASLLEHNAALCCIHLPDFRDIEEQVSRIMVRTSGVRPSPYWFDFRLTLTSGKRIAIAVKPEKERATYEFRRKLGVIRSVAVPEIADHVHVISERNINPIRLARAKLFHAARVPDPERDLFVRSELAGMDRPRSIREFLDQSPVGREGWWSVIRAIRAGIIEVANCEPITEHSIISNPGAA
ncbi:hypothetical protein [Alloyangia pacifica]|uniref:TnsA endonuclease N-terminal domain-containing protein n=1 Tax=Alloyangia pacifica TaxID=311180 RepID=A0A1I6WN62_9RHOB|nr:hypothetical protein [Alloyangia pacifica]SDI92125.1 hypothetical protein SAMN04488245_1316 [Alloyangia pacifica]SFT26964.1 hypothetical protein SAMN04488050_1276 [Alloyangia pacifica]